MKSPATSASDEVDGHVAADDAVDAGGDLAAAALALAADPAQEAVEQARALEQQEEGEDEDGDRADEVLEEADGERLELAGGAREVARELRGLRLQGVGQVVLRVEVAELVVVVRPVLGVADVAGAEGADLLDLVDHRRDHVEDEEGECEEGERRSVDRDREPARRLPAADPDPLDRARRPGASTRARKSRRDEPADRRVDLDDDEAEQGGGGDRQDRDGDDPEHGPGIDLVAVHGKAASVVLAGFPVSARVPAG